MNKRIGIETPVGEVWLYLRKPFPASHKERVLLVKEEMRMIFRGRLMQDKAGMRKVKALLSDKNDEKWKFYTYDEGLR